MKQTIGIPSALRLAFAISSVLAAILQAIAVLTAYDTSANYFEQSAILPILAVCFAIIGAICGTVAARMTDTATLNSSPFSKRNAFPYAALGFLLTAILLVLYGSAERMNLTPLTSIFLILAALYSILSELSDFREKHTTLLTFLGFAAVIGCILLTAYFYFDVSVEMNAPLKVTTQIGLITAMVGYTGEIRYLLGKPMPRVYLMLASWTVAVGSLAALSVPIASLTQKLPRADYAAGAVLVLCLVLTQLMRIRTLLTKTAHNAQDTPAADESEETNGKDLT